MDANDLVVEEHSAAAISSSRPVIGICKFAVSSLNMRVHNMAAVKPATDSPLTEEAIPMHMTFIAFHTADHLLYSSTHEDKSRHASIIEQTDELRIGQ